MCLTYYCCLDTSVELMAERVAARGQDGDQLIDLEYLRHNRALHGWLLDNNLIH